MIAIENSQDGSLRKVVIDNAKDESALVRGASVWALSKLEETSTFSDLRNKALASETDESVREEWNAHG